MKWTLTEIARAACETRASPTTQKGDTLMKPLTTHERMTLVFRHEQPDRVLFWYG